MELYSLSELRYKRMTKENTDGKYDKELKNYMALTNCIHSINSIEDPLMTRENQRVIQKDLEPLITNGINNILNKIQKSFN